MPAGSAALSPVQKGRVWRVRIKWPNGTVRHFGKFASEKAAMGWITSHPWLAEAPNKGPPQLVSRRVRSRARRFEEHLFERIHSPNHHEFGSGIALPLFKMRSPFTHRIRVQMAHHIKMKPPTTKWIVRRPTKKYTKPIQNVVI